MDCERMAAPARELSVSRLLQANPLQSFAATESRLAAIMSVSRPTADAPQDAPQPPAGTAIIVG